MADNLHETLEIIVGETLPALLIWWFDPQCGVPLLIFHYVYEILATDALLEHNPDIRAPIWVRNFAVGQFHLEHHRRPTTNFGFTITLWVRSIFLVVKSTGKPLSFLYSFLFIRYFVLYTGSPIWHVSKPV